jgi:hypothetical protein
MDDAERERRNADAVGLFFRVKHAVLGVALVTLGTAIAAWLWAGDVGDDGRGPGPWPWVAVAGCVLAGPLLLWKAVRGR